jgi:hypothetical protein
MSDETFKVQWSVSLPPVAQYAKGHMLNLRGQTVEEVNELLDAVLENDGTFLVKAIEVGSVLLVAQGLNSLTLPLIRRRPCAPLVRSTRRTSASMASGTTRPATVPVASGRATSALSPRARLTSVPWSGSTTSDERVVPRCHRAGESR